MFPKWPQWQHSDDFSLEGFVWQDPDGRPISGYGLTGQFSWLDMREFEALFGMVWLSRHLMVFDYHGRW